MTKLICPIAGCNKSEWKTPNPQQSHVNRHLEVVHHVRVNKTNEDSWRKRQDKTWETLHQAATEGARSTARRMRAEWNAFAKDPSLPLPQLTAHDHEEKADLYEKLMNVWEDQQEAPEPIFKDVSAIVASTRSEWFGTGPGYAVSLRSTAYSHKSHAEATADLKWAEGLKVPKRTDSGLGKRSSAGNLAERPNKRRSLHTEISEGYRPLPGERW